MDNEFIKENANKILYKDRLLDKLNQYGNSYIIGSYK